MVCYARGAGRMGAIVLIVLLAFGRVIIHDLGAAAILVAVAVATAGASIAAALAFAAFLTTRRDRAAAGECVNCGFRCQHAMTERPRRLALVSSVDRSAAPARRPERAAGPRCPDEPGGSAGPRWPDRPAYRSVPPRAPAPDRGRVPQLRA